MFAILYSIWFHFSYSQDSWVQESKDGNGSSTTTITLSDPPEKFLLPVPVVLGCAGPEVLVRKEGTPGNTAMVPLNWKLRWLPGHSGLLMPLNQQAKKRFTVLTRVFDHGCQGEIGLLPHSRGEKDYAGHMRTLKALSFAPSCDQVNEKLYQHSPGRTTVGPKPSGMKIGVMPPCKEP